MTHVAIAKAVDVVTDVAVATAVDVATDVVAERLRLKESFVYFLELMVSHNTKHSSRLLIQTMRKKTSKFKSCSSVK